MKYWPEFIALSLLAIVSILGVDFYRDIQTFEQHKTIKGEINKSVVEFSLESVSMVSPTIFHYDQHAQYRLKIDQLLKKLPNENYELIKKVRLFEEETTQYLQVATMLKTSKKLVTSLSETLVNAPFNIQNITNELIVLVNNYSFLPSYNKASKVTEFITKHDTDFEALNDFDVQWNMIKLHIDFILKNSNKVDISVEKEKSSSLVGYITQSQIESEQLMQASRKQLFICISIGIICLLSTFILALTRQAVVLKKRTREAKKASEVKSQFLANMSHEIRTPMNGIIGLSDIVLDTELSSTQRDFMEKLKFSARSLMTIINDILDFSKIESKSLTIEKIDFNLDELLDHLKVMIGYKASDKGLELVFKLEEDLSDYYKGDPIRINQIILNLISNAIKFTEEGSVIVTVKPESKVFSGKVCAGVSFSVADTGIGLSDEQQSRLFKRFNQAELSTTRKYGGTGLGLAISKLLSELMDGEITVTSEQGKGSCFSLFLPLEPSTEIILPELKVERLVGRSILVVEDDQNTSDVTSRLLKKLNMDVTCVSDIQSALSNIKSNSYDVVLTDWCLPDLNGDMLIAALLNQEYPIHKIIIFTAFNADHLKISKDYTILHKPLITKDLIKALNHAVGGSKTDKEPLKDIPVVSPVASIDQEFMPHFTQPSSEIMSDLAAELTTNRLENDSEKHQPANADKERDENKVINILFAEDNRINATIVQNVLSNINSNVVHVENGLLALEAMEASQFDIILMDVQMPIMDGMEATRIIRTELKKDLPIIAFTANILPNEVQEYKAIGVTDHIGKPFEKEDLINLVLKYTA